ncbi:MAG TPA: hypothetical protein ENF41_04325 [Candidatus Bathyarchaeota archaeon]|nr:hypothetical protein [Candidatus Bathyarchaeota archaeon]
MSRILIIDLTRKAYHIEEYEIIFQKRLGGTGVGIKLLAEYLKPNTPPLSPGNPVIFTIGLLTGVYPAVGIPSHQKN